MIECKSPDRSFDNLALHFAFPGSKIPEPNFTAHVRRDEFPSRTAKTESNYRILVTLELAILSSDQIFDPNAVVRTIDRKQCSVSTESCGSHAIGSNRKIDILLLAFTNK